MSHTDEEKPKPAGRTLFRLVALTAVLAFMATVAVAGLLITIFEHKQEAKNPFFRVVELTDETEDPAVWGKNFPFQYDGYMRTVDMVRTRYGGSEAIPRTPSAADPRSVISFSRIEDDPRLKIMWAGYAFAIDFREERGHAYMLEDQTFTTRQQKPQVGACVHCHASIYVAYKRLGDGDLIKGFEKMNPMPYLEARAYVERPIGCIDCHDPETMQLRITRPGFLEGIRVLKANEGIENYEVNTTASRQEMRSYVCAQCHVEYYFQGEEKRLTYPWFQGRRADEILAYYDATGFADWTHARTEARVLKAQHPEFEMWSQGLHSRSGVACADCHMPYTRVGAMKISDHHVRSPLLNLNNACQTCHRISQDELRDRVEKIQTTTFELRNAALDALLELIQDIEERIVAGAAEEELAAACDFQRRAQFLIDFVEAENSMGFHAPQEAARIAALSIDASRKGQNALRGLKAAE